MYQLKFHSNVRIFLRLCLQELFVSYLAQQTQRSCNAVRELNYEDLSSFVQKTDKLEFLHEIVPEKITVKQFRDILARGDQSESDSNSSDSSEDSSEELSNDDDDDSESEPEKEA